VETILARIFPEMPDWFIVEERISRLVERNFDFMRFQSGSSGRSGIELFPASTVENSLDITRVQ
jgi:hypothetical protein